MRTLGYSFPQGEALRRCVPNGGTKKGKKVRMPSKISDLARMPPWIITSYRNNRMEVLTIDPDGDDGGRSLPVFSFKEEAQTFLGSRRMTRRRGEGGAVGRLQRESWPRF